MSIDREQGRVDYRIFSEPEAQRDIYEISQAVSEYLRNLHKEAHQPANLLLIDTSARAAWRGIATYMDTMYANVEKPHIYFVNPRGMKPTAEERMGLIFPNEAAMQETDNPELLKDIRTAEEIDLDLLRTYPRLMKQKQAPTLVLDTCMHTGDTMKPVLETLQRTGFTDVRVGVMSNHRNGSDVPVDFVALPEIPHYSCHPFYYEGAVNKQYSPSHSVRANSSYADRVHSRQVRTEINQIIKDNLPKQPGETIQELISPHGVHEQAQSHHSSRVKQFYQAFKRKLIG